MSNTGGGHRASAQALEAAIRLRYPGQFQVEIVDLWSDYTPWPINQLPHFYSPIVANALWLWKLLWTVSENDTTVSFLIRLLYLICRRDLRGLLREHQPDLIVSVHPLMQHIPLRLLRKERVHIPFVTVVTDLVSVNPTWFHPRVDRCFVASEKAAADAQGQGLRPQQIRLLGLPIRPAFAQPLPDREAMRVQLGLKGGGRTALLVGGGEGMGPVAEIAQAVAQRLHTDGRNGQLAVICGRNARLRQALQQLDWPLPVQVLGFVENMPEWMTAADCIITKAGPGTIAEAMICGLPILLSGFIPGQEEGNVPFVVENGVGTYAEEPDAIAAIVSRWFGPDQAELAEMAACSKALGRPQASFEIVEEIVALLEPTHQPR